jgi:hypothetical protein
MRRLALALIVVATTGCRSITWCELNYQNQRIDKLEEAYIKLNNLCAESFIDQESRLRELEGKTVNGVTKEAK